MFHISDVKKYMRCPKMFWNALHEVNSEPFMHFVRMDQAVTELVLKKLKVQDYYLGQRNDPTEKAMIASESIDWLVKARFEYEALRIKLPIMHHVKKQWDIYFIYTGLYPKNDDLHYYCSHVWVLQKLGFQLGKIRIVHLNKDYVRENELDVDSLFLVSNEFYNAKGNPSGSITATIQSRVQNLSHILLEMNEVAHAESFYMGKNKQCIRKNRCTYYDLCFSEEKQGEEDSILHLVSSQYKNEMLQQGIRQMKDALLDKIEGSRQQFAQIMASQNGGLFIDRIALKNWLQTELVYPLSFLDFEWETYAIPPYSGLKPFDVVPFQYSLHILQKEQSLQHCEYIGVQDCREQFIQKLIQDIPKKGSIVAYNGEGAEKIRLIELAEQFPAYSRQLKEMCHRIVDLSIPFMNGLVYDIRMHGLYSLKVLLSVFSNEYDYANLDIHHGMDAVFKWRSLDKKEKTEEDIEQQLMDYCGMDTYAMVILVQWLQKQARGNNNENL